MPFFNLGAFDCTLLFAITGGHDWAVMTLFSVCDSACVLLRACVRDIAYSPGSVPGLTLIFPPACPTP